MPDPSPADDFEELKAKHIALLGDAGDLRKLSLQWLRDVSRLRYSYHFTWLGRPIIQFPQDIVALQEVIWEVKPDLIVETGVARGGSLILSASILELLGGDGEVIGIDLDIRPHNRAEIERHSLSRRIRLISGSSTSPAVVATVTEAAASAKCVLVILDSHHAHDHVLAELHAYGRLVGLGSYLIVMDTIIEDLPPDFFPDRSWGPGNSPKTAVHEYLKSTDRFVIDRSIDGKLLITAAPDGYLRCVKQ